MKLVVQRAAQAQVSIAGEVVGRLGAPGLVVLAGVTHTDTPELATRLADKTWNLRIMAVERSAADLSAPILVVSQFTLYADTRKGRRPSWRFAAPGPVSEPIVDAYVAALRSLGAHVETGVFGADMQVELVNDGPVTILLDSADFD
jgi:D-tyrosyl-tRNA(Tyr) deacylase